MADTAFGQVGGKLVEKLFSGIIWFGVGVIIAGVLTGLIWYFLVHKRKFDIKVIIKSQRSGGKIAIIEDMAAILTDRKTRTAYFRVWGLKRDFPVPKYEVLQKTNKGDLLEMYRAGEEEFYFLFPAKIEKTRIVKADGKLYPFASSKQIMLDPEMGFWAAKRKDKNKKMFDTESLLMKLLPYLPIIFGGIITIFILYILLDHLPEILSQLQELAKTMQSSQRAQVTTG